MTLAGMEEGFVTDYFRDNYLNNGIVDKNPAQGFLCGPPPMIDAEKFN